MIENAGASAAGQGTETISVVMANWRGAEFLPAAIASVLGQSHGDLELIVADDASDDDSAAIVRDAATRDPRVVLIAMPRNGGPSAARNAALDRARGDWIAIADSDDLMHPDRLARMLAAAGELAADVVADDMVYFGEMPGTGGRTLLQPLALTGPKEITAADFVAANAGRADWPPLGYVKPLIRRGVLGDLRYDPAVRVGEDYDFVLRLLLGGPSLWLLPDPTYLYRRHDASLSHRLSVAALEPLLAAHDRLDADVVSRGLETPELRAAMDTRRRDLLTQLGYERLVQDVKGRDAVAVAAALARDPGHALRLARSLRERLARRRQVAAVPERTERSIVLTTTPQPADGDSPAEDHVQVGAIAPPGRPGAAGMAETAARLSALYERHRLTVTAADEAARFWLGAVPPARSR